MVDKKGPELSPYELDGIIVIRKGGYLWENSWVPPIFKSEDPKSDDYLVVDKPGYFVWEDITEDTPCHMYDVCTLERGVTLRDIFLLCEKHKDFFSMLHKRNLFSEYLKFGLESEVKDLSDGYTFEYGITQQCFTIHRSLTRHAAYTFTEDLTIGADKSSMTLAKAGEDAPDFTEYYIDFMGTSAPLTEEYCSKENENGCGYSPGETINLAVSGCELRNVIDLPVIIKEDMTVLSVEKNNDKFEYKNYDFGKVQFDLGEIINAIFFELSFNGSPEKSAEFIQMLDERRWEVVQELENK